MNNCRTEMFWALALFTLTSCVYGWSQLEAAEGTNVTLHWESAGSITSSDLILYCFHKPLKHRSAMYRMVLEVSEGTQRPGSTGTQFSGRVLWDTGVLSLGQVRIVLTRITARDQGIYWCYMYADYHPPSRRWTRVHYEYFNLTVTSDKETGVRSRDHAEWETSGEHQEPQGGARGNVFVSLDEKSELGLFQKIVLGVMYTCMMLMTLGIVLAWLYRQCV